MVALRAAIAVPLLAVAIYAYSLAGPFHLDDFALFNDPLIMSPEGWWRLWRIEQTRPLTWLSFWANYQIAGTTTWAWHAGNVLLHGLASWLVLDVLSRLIPRRAAVVAAVIFAIHPIQSEAVAYIFARSSQLAAVFSLLAMRSWTLGRHWQAAMWFVPALLAKEECVALPIFFALLHWSISRNRKEWAPIGAMLALSVAAGLRVLFAISVTPGAGVGSEAGVSWLEYLGMQGLAILRYLDPIPIFFKPFPEWRPSPVGWMGWAVPAALSAFSLRHFRGAKAGFWFLAGMVLLLPSSSIFPAADLAADRRMYLPMAAFSASLALVLRPKFLLVLGVALSVITIYRVHIWNSEERLWRLAGQYSQDHLRPRIHLARALPPSESVNVLLEAKKIAADSPQLASELGRAYLASNKPGEALAEFGRALALEPGNPQHLVNRGAVLAILDQKEEAAGDFRRALQMRHCMPEAVTNLVQLGETVDCKDVK